MRMKQIGWNRFRNQRGDTIVEVMIAITVISVILAGAFVVSQKSTNNVQDSQEHTMAQQVLQGQVEKLRTVLGGSDRSVATDLITLSNNGSAFCMLDASPFFATSTDARCKKVENLYNLTITQAGTTYKLKATWDRLGSSTSTADMYYRVYASSGAITAPDSGEISGEYFPDYQNVDSDTAPGNTLFTGLYTTGTNRFDNVDAHWKLMNAYKSYDGGTTPNGAGHCQTVSYSNYGRSRVPLPIYPNVDAGTGQAAQIINPANPSMNPADGYAFVRPSAATNNAGWIGLDDNGNEGPSCLFNLSGPTTYYNFQLIGGFNISSSPALSSYPNATDPNHLKLKITGMADDSFSVFLNGSQVTGWIAGPSTSTTAWWHSPTGVTVNITDSSKFKTGNNKLEIRVASGPNRMGLMIKEIQLSGRVDKKKL